MSRRTWSSLLVGALLVGASALPLSGAEASAEADSSARSATALTTAQFESRLLALTNARRTKVGCSALRANTALTTAARRHTALMVKTKNLSHQLPGELGLVSRILKAGYSKNWSGMAENIAWGGATPARTFSMWMNSAGHRANIERCRYKDVGFGVVYNNGTPWVTLDLGSHR